MRRRLLLFAVFLAVAAMAGGAWWGSGVAGAGALHQSAPTAVSAGAPFEIKVLAGVWGEGRAAHVRYSDWSLQLLRQGKPLGSPVGPASTSKEADRLAVRFQLTAPDAAPQGDLTWQLRFVFDREQKQAKGTHAIAVDLAAVIAAPR